MTIAYACLVVMMFVPLICAGYAKFSTRGFDNHHPRDFLDKLQGKGRRANYAQMNTFESFPPFAAGVIVAHLMGAPQNILDALAVAFVVCRILYAYFYIQDRPTLRSMVWFAGFAATVALFFIGA